LQPIEEDIFVALPEPNVLLVAESRADIEFMIRAVRDKRQAIPDRWTAAANGIDAKAPLVILRRYDPKNERDGLSPVNPRRELGAVDIESAGLAYLPKERRPFTLRVLSKDRPAASRYFQTHALDALAFEWPRDIRQEETGFQVELGILPCHEAEVCLHILFFFGPNIAI
jgi:hypothetical protein